MSNPLPCIKHSYSQEYMEKLQPAQKTAARYGVEPMFLKFASTASISDPEEEYRLHNFSTICVGSKIVAHDEQFNNALELLNSGHLWCDPPSIIVVNSPRHLFTGKYRKKEEAIEDLPDFVKAKIKDKQKEEDKSFRGPMPFIAHLACSLAYRVSTLKAPHTTVNYLDMTGGGIDISKKYDMNPRHLFVWGPITDHSNPYDYGKTIQFLYTFRNHSKILLTSTRDLTGLLDNLRIDIDHIPYIFNFDTEKGDTRAEADAELTKAEKAAKIVKEAKAKKSKPKKEKKLNESV